MIARREWKCGWLACCEQVACGGKGGCSRQVKDSGCGGSGLWWDGGVSWLGGGVLSEPVPGRWWFMASHLRR